VLPRADPELEPLLEEEFYAEPPELKERLDMEENRGRCVPEDEPP
jgi:hypothetical protein